MGDTNTGRSEIDEENKFFNERENNWFNRIHSAGWVDIWRNQNPDKREFTYYHHGRPGFRLGQVFAPNQFLTQLINIRYDWGGGGREAKLSDHAAIVFEALANPLQDSHQKAFTMLVQLNRLSMPLLTLTIAIAGCSGGNSSALTKSAGDTELSVGTESSAPADNTGFAPTKDIGVPESSYERPWIYSSEATATDWNDWSDTKRRNWCYTYYSDLYPAHRVKSFAPLLIVAISQAIKKESNSGWSPDKIDLVDLTRTSDKQMVRKEYKNLFDD